MTNMMKAIQISATGDASVLKQQEVPVPQPGPEEALIQVKAAGLNFIDIYQRTGHYPQPLPYIPGREGAGVVTAVGNQVKHIAVGDRVAYAGNLGTYAEYNLVPADQLIPLPKDITFEQGAAFPLQGMTAHYLLHEYHTIKPSDTILVHAAAGGVGLLLVQWIKKLGAKVIGTVSTKEKATVAKAAGADHVILYTEQDFVTETKKLTGGEGAHYIIDGVGKTTFTKDLEAVCAHGHICLFGSSSGPADSLAPNSLQAKSLTISGGSLFNQVNTRDALLKRANAVLTGMREGWLTLKIDHVFPLSKAADAQRMLEGRATMGKVILTMSEK